MGYNETPMKGIIMELDIYEIAKKSLVSYNRAVKRLDKINEIKTTAIRIGVVVGAIGTLTYISHKMKNSDR